MVAGIVVLSARNLWCRGKIFESNFDLQCSTSCGQGTQTRAVTCNKNPADTLECDPTKKPATEQKCVGDSCQGG